MELPSLILDALHTINYRINKQVSTFKDAVKMQAPGIYVLKLTHLVLV